MLKPNFPIIDLHCHLEGSIDPQKSYEILHRVGYAPAQNREEFFRNVTGFESGKQGFFGAVSLLDTCLIDRTAVIEVVSDIVARAAEQNVKILEMSFAPRTRFKLQESTVNHEREYMEALLTGVETGTRNRDIAVGLTMLFLPRHFSRELEVYCVNIKELLTNYRQYLTGVDICTLDPINTRPFELSELQELCHLVREAGLHLSAHAGEFFNAKPVEQAVRLGVERIGHGIQIAYDDEMLELVKAHNITLEVCPVSNYRTGALAPDCEHPLRRLLHAGVKVTINSDDQGVQNSTWRDDYVFAMEQIGLTENEIAHCLRNSFDASFLPPQRKETYREIFVS